MADELDKNDRANSFLHRFRQLIQAGSGDKWRRKSAMVLTLKLTKEKSLNTR
jgi:hypothetical protein